MIDYTKRDLIKIGGGVIIMMGDGEQILAAEFFAEFPTMIKLHRNVRKNGVTFSAFDWLKQHCYSVKMCHHIDDFFHHFSEETLEQKLYSWFLAHEADQFTLTFSKNPSSNIILFHDESLSHEKNSHVKKLSNNSVLKIINIEKRPRFGSWACE